MLPQMKTAGSILAALQAEILGIVEAVGTDGMNWVPPYPETNSIYALATHTIQSQLWWIKENLDGQKIERDRPAEFTASATDILLLKKRFSEIQAQTVEILEKLAAEDLGKTREVKGKNVTVEWIVLHVIEHTALHLGHMQITKQLWEGR